MTISRQERWLIKIRRKGKEKMRAESDREKSGARSFMGQHVESNVQATVVSGETLPRESLDDFAQL